MLPTSISSLSGAVLSIILRYSGTLALHELYSTGDRFLLVKLNCQECAIDYYNKDEYEQYVPWCGYMLAQLKGLRSISITVEPNRPPAIKPDLSYFTNSSREVIQSIRLEEDLEEGADCIATRAFGLLDWSSFPHLTQLHHELKDNSSYGKPPPWQVNTQLSGYVQLLPQLTHLSLGKVLKYTPEELGSFPPNLESLLIGTYEMIGLSWLRRLSCLKKLEIRHMKVWEISQSDFEGENAVLRCLPLVELKCPTLKRFHLNMGVIEGPNLCLQFFSSLKELQILLVPHFELFREQWHELVKLRKLSFLLKVYKSEHLSQFPPLLSKLSIIDLLDNTSIPSLVASSLRHFLNWDLILTPENVACLPQTLSSLKARELRLEEKTCKLLPSSLKYLFLQSCKFEKTLPYLHGGIHICRDWSRVFVQTHSETPSKPNWTDFFGSLLRNDLQSLLAILRESHSNGSSFHWPVADWGQARSNLSSVVSSLEWLLMRGVLASPAQVGSINEVRFFKFINSSSDKRLFRWMADHMTMKSWRTLAKDIAKQGLTGSAYHEILDCLKNSGFSVGEPS